MTLRKSLMAVSLALAAGLALFLVLGAVLQGGGLGALWGAHLGGNFYHLFPHNLLVAMFGTVFGFPVLPLAIGALLYASGVLDRFDPHNVAQDEAVLRSGLAHHPWLGPLVQIGAIALVIATGVPGGILLVLVIGVPGLGLYALGRAFGITVQVDAAPLDPSWWTVPLLVLAALRARGLR